MLWLSAAWAHSGHEAETFNSLDITNSICCRDFRLTDVDGNARTLEDFRGQIVVLLFGYTHCPDVCPTTLSSLAKTRAKLGANGKRVQVLFVTLDPARDSAEVLRRYTSSFDPTFIALRGSEKAIAKVARDFRIIYQVDKSKPGTAYTIYHMAGTYVFDVSGRPRLFVSTEKPELLVHDLETLLGESSMAAASASD
jgi:protein SCO1/2